MTAEALSKLYIDRPDENIRENIKNIWNGIAKPLKGLGQFETIFAQIGAITGTTHIDISKKAVIVMCADNGIVEEGVTQYGQEMTSIIASSMVMKDTSVCKMAKVTGADILPVDIGINRDNEIGGMIQRNIAHGTRNFKKEPAMSQEDALKAIEVGIAMVADCKEQGYSLVATGEMGIGNTTTSSAMTAALLQCRVEDVTGKGAGLSREGVNRKVEVIKEALDNYNFHKSETLRILATVGGYDIAGLTGVFIGGAVHHIPVVMDGVISGVAALTAERLVPGVKDYIIPSHLSKEPAAIKIMEELGLHPVIHGEMALGEGTGAVMMFSLLDMALSLYDNPVTFEDINRIGK